MMLLFHAAYFMLAFGNDAAQAQSIASDVVDAIVGSDDDGDD